MHRILIIIERISIGGTGSSLINLLHSLCDDCNYCVEVGLINGPTNSIERKYSGFSCVDLSMIKRPQWGKLTKAIKLFTNKDGRYVIKERLRSTRKINKSLKPIQVSDLIYSNYANEIDLSAEYDVVISWCELYTNYLLANKIKAQKKIGFIHPDYIQARFDAKTDYESFSKIDMLCAVSETGEKSLKEAFPMFGGKICHIHNKLVVDDILEKSLETVVDFDSNKINIITVARLQNFSKGFDRIVRCVEILVKIGYSFIWHIIGDGEDKESIVQDIKRRNLDNVIVLYGEKSNPYPYVKHADLFALCSYYEGFPVVIDEAIALNTPCFVTKYMAAEEQVKDTFGFVVENTEEGIIDGLKRILDNPKLLDEKKSYLKGMDKSYFSDCTDFYSMIDRCINL